MAGSALGSCLLKWCAPPGSLRRRLLHRGKRLAQRYLTRRGLAPLALGGRVAALDVYDAADRERFLRECGVLPPRAGAPDADRGEAGAARFALALLLERPGLRARFPRALTGGGRSRYAAWLASAGAAELGLSSGAVAHLRGAFAAGAGERVRRVYDHDPGLRELFPLALMACGQRPFARHLLGPAGAAYGLHPEDVWWFLLECAEDPAGGVAATYLRSPDWQERFPLGLTTFGWDGLLGWVRRRYRLPEGALAGLPPPGVLEPLDEVRLLHAHTTALRALAPRAFAERGDTERLVRWLGDGREASGPGEARWWRRVRAGVAAGLAERPGVNLLGHFRYPSGLCEAVTAAARALRAAGVRTSCRDVPASPQHDLPGRSGYLGPELFDHTLLLVAPEPLFDDCYPLSGLWRRPGVYRIAYWYWELEAVPPAWARHARLVREVWAPTQFIARAMRGALPLPVVDMLPGVRVGSFPPRPRSHFGLPADRFLFLFAFDMCSVMERKNPLGVVRAYRRAFGPDDRVALAIKVTRGDSDRPALERLRREAGAAGVTVIDRLLSREESYALLDSCDCYVSLHRSEGLGLTMAEAMLLGKPVIATAYSGNLDFMTPANSLLVPHQRVPITEALPFYRQGSWWAEPSTEHAARWMRWAYEHPAEARALGARARAEVGRLLDPVAAGRRMAARLRALGAGERLADRRAEAA